MLLTSMNWFILSLVYLQGTTSVFSDNDWQNWKGQHNRTYINNTSEESTRLGNFVRTLQLINSHNSKLERNEVSYRAKANRLSDLSVDELQSRLGFRQDLRPPTAMFAPDGVMMDVPIEAQFLPDPAIVAAPAIDWRTKGAVTAVKDQGPCGSCWAFSAAGALEGAFFLKYKNVTDLSEQNFMDCSWDLGNGGCNGGSMNLAFLSNYQQGGVATETVYPYKAKSSQTCLFNKTTSTAPVKSPSYIKIQAGNETALMLAVNQGPVSFGFQVINTFYYYSSGIYSDPACGTALNHGMLIVGYGTDTTRTPPLPYWLVKNSWGKWWGESGYARVIRGKNMCGIANSASYPVMA